MRMRTIHALALSGYDTQWPQVQLIDIRQQEEVENIMQPHTIEQQNTLATACTHGGLFKESLGLNLNYYIKLLHTIPLIT